MDLMDQIELRGEIRGEARGVATTLRKVLAGQLAERFGPLMKRHSPGSPRPARRRCSSGSAVCSLHPRSAPSSTGTEVSRTLTV